MMTRTRFATLVAVFVTLGSAAHAARPAAPLAKETKAYLKESQAQARTVKIDLLGKVVTRTFVPVTPATEAAFKKTFHAGKGALVIRQGTDLEHPIVLWEGDKTLNHEQYWSTKDQRFTPLPANFAYGAHLKFEVSNPLQRFITLHLDADTMKALEKHWLETDRPEGAKSGCMWWLVHAEAKGASLAHLMGVKRAGATSNLIKKLLHAGNERVAVVGVGVPDLDAFSKLTDQELLGVPPGGGALEAIKD